MGHIRIALLVLLSRIALLVLLSCLIGICPKAKAKPDSKNPFWVTWEKTLHTDKNLVRVHFANKQNGWVVGQGGTILATHNGGTSWEKQRSDTDNHLLGVHFANKQTGWVVGQRGTLLATHNGGTSWEAQHSDTDKNLLGVHFADAQNGWVVGEGGTMLRAAEFFKSPSVDDARARTSSGGEVDVSFRIVADEHTAPTRMVSVTAYVGETGWISVGKPTTSPGSDGRWHAAWKPKEERQLGEGNSFEYNVVIDDNGPLLPPFLIGPFDFLPPDPSLWRVGKVLISSGVIYFALIFPLIPLYPRFSWARTAINSGIFTKFPLLHKTILNMRWARAICFRSLRRKRAAPNCPSPISHSPCSRQRTRTQSR